MKVDMKVDIGLPTVRRRVIFGEANFSFPIRSYPAWL